MNFWAVNFVLSTVIWSCLCNHTLLYIYLLFVVLYLFIYVLYGQFSITTFRQQINQSLWNDSGNPSVFSRLQIDLTPIDKFLNDYNSKHPED